MGAQVRSQVGPDVGGVDGSGEWGVRSHKSTSQAADDPGRRGMIALPGPGAGDCFYDLAEGKRPSWRKWAMNWAARRRPSTSRRVEVGKDGEGASGLAT